MSWGKKSNQPWLDTLYHVRDRCKNPSSTSYPRYGGRGIKCLLSANEIMVLWKRDVVKGMVKPSIDRINPDGHYEFKNCRFIAFSENVSRQRHVRKLKYEDILYIRANYKHGMGPELGRKYNVTAKTIIDTASGRKWKRVLPENKCAKRKS